MSDSRYALSRMGDRCAEPEKRMVAGHFRWAVHRFPIVGGLPVAHIWAKMITEDISRPNYFASLLGSANRTPPPVAKDAADLVEWEFHDWLIRNSGKFLVDATEN